jgi:hypothetical protein
MKAWKRKVCGVVCALLFCISPVSAFAADVTISSGLALDAEEATFDDSRLVYGEAAPGTEISFTVSEMDYAGVLTEQYRTDVTVGSMGLFSVTLPLEKGSNYICILSGEQKQEAVVKRVSQMVKSHLKNMIALPGLQETF